MAVATGKITGATFAGGFTASATVYTPPQTYQGTASFAGAGGLTANADPQTRQGTASFAGAGGLTVDATVVIGSVTYQGTATFSGIGAFSGNADAQERQGSATLAGVGGFTASGTVPSISTSGAVPLIPGAGFVEESLTAAELVPGVGFVNDIYSSSATAYQGSATLSGSGAISADSTVITGGSAQQGSATFSGVGGLTAYSAQLEVGSALFAGAGSLSSSAALKAYASVSFDGVGALFADSITLSPGILLGTAQLDGVGSLTVDGTVIEGERESTGLLPAGRSGGGKAKTKKRKVIVGDRVYEVDSLRDVEFLLKRVVREDAESVTKSAKAVVKVVDRVSTKVEPEAPLSLPVASEADWMSLWRQLSEQDQAYAEILLRVLEKQEEDDIESLLWMI